MPAQSRFSAAVRRRTHAGSARGRVWEVLPYPAVGQRPCGQFLYWKSHDRASAGIKFHKYAFSDSGKNMGPGTPSAAACARSFSLFRKASPYPFHDKTACRPSAFPGRPAVCPPSICRSRIRPPDRGFLPLQSKRKRRPPNAHNLSYG